jgi:hypothetical protein
MSYAVRKEANFDNETTATKQGKLHSAMLTVMKKAQASKAKKGTKQTGKAKAIRKPQAKPVIISHKGQGKRIDEMLLRKSGATVQEIMAECQTTEQRVNNHIAAVRGIRGAAVGMTVVLTSDKRKGKSVYKAMPYAEAQALSK